MNRRVFTKIVLCFFLFLNFLGIIMSTRIDYTPYVSTQFYFSVLLGQLRDFLVIQIVFFFIVFIPRLRTLNKSLLWSVFALVPIVNDFYCIYLCIKKSDKDQIKENSLPTRKGLKRIPYLITLFPIIYVSLYLQALSDFSIDDVFTVHQLSNELINCYLLTLCQELVAILWCYFCLSKRLIDAGEDPYKSWLIVVPFYNIYFMFKWCFIRPLNNSAPLANNIVEQDAEAQFNRGTMYLNGEVVKLDYAEAFRCFKKAAELGHVKAQCNLGIMYTYGKGVDQDYTKACKWFQKAAKQGDVKAQYFLGTIYAKGYGVGQDYAEAFKWYKRAAEQGDAKGQCNLGVLYANGYGVKQDYAEAFKWYKRAAVQGNIKAQCILGTMYDNGESVEQDYAEAFKWYKKAADQGDALAQCKLGMMYDDGLGVKQDYVEAFKWFKKAAEKGLGEAQGLLGFMYETGRGVEQDYAEAFKCYKKGAEQGHANSQYSLGVMYYAGLGVETDIQKAINWWIKAAALGQAQAQENLRKLGK